MSKTIFFGHVPLAKQCEYCYGDGTVERYDDKSNYQKLLECGECDGKGGHLTDEGQAILELVKEYGDSDE